MPDGPAPTVQSNRRDNHMRLLLSEIYLLLTHIQGVPDRHLTRYFGQGPRLLQERDGTPVPPTWDLTYFLGRIAAIESSGPKFNPNAFTEAGINPPTAPPNPLTPSAGIQSEAQSASPAAPLATSTVDPGPKLTNLAFLIWTQDFLAAVAAPVTVETLIVTQAFRVARMSKTLGKLPNRALQIWSSTWPSSAAGEDQDGEDTRLAIGFTMEHATLRAYGARLASRVTKLSWVTAAIILFTVWASALVYTGRVLIRENATLQTAYKDLATRIALADKDDRAALLTDFEKDGGKLDGSDRTSFYCEISFPPLATSMKAQPRFQAVAAQSTATDWSPDVRTYLRPVQRSLCAEYSRLERRSDELKGQHGRWVSIAAPFRYFMTPSSAVRDVYSSFRGKPPDCDVGCVMRSLDLETHRYSMEEVVDGIIGGVLPVTYALLGSLAALFRSLNARADTSLLSPSDYGSIRNTMILGVITGSVIGLFSDSLGWGTHETSSIPLAPTALALLGGFASERVFALFESLSERVFGETKAVVSTASGMKSAS